ncbi:MAG: LiaI-LiaF-like domain-containing protein [Candidatus Limnocylindrales bacterium]
MSQWDRRDPGRGEWTGISIAGVVLIVLGAIFLVDQVGLFDFAWRLLWPVLLIAIGAGLLISVAGRSGGHSASQLHGAGAASATIARDGAGRLQLEIGLGGGTFRFGGGSNQLVEVHSATLDIAAQQRHEADLAQVRLRQDLASFGAWRGAANWEIRTASDIPTRLRFDAGAGSFDIDLSAVQIVEAHLQVGAARTRIVLPRPHGSVLVSITGGAASFSIEVPAGVEYQLESSGGLTSVDGRTESPGYAGAADRVLVRFTGGASSVRIG